MNFKDIPVGALTHLYFSFGYVTPGSYMIAPMDDLKPELFEEFTALKSKNPGLKTVVALGGWTFTDPGATQTVFSDMVASAENRKKFIGNLMGFMRKYAFDGVDFDWEYPGAPDRGGRPDDGKNFVTFLKELDDVNNQQPEKYVVSFTVPTSYWYLRWFDLSAVKHVDYINVMSYDLHGTWDSTNPIGNHIYAHTNLTEIKMALDLFWRNGVEAGKLNLGFGFYGRSFQLSDPTCHTPGCQFKGGAAPGPCSQNSGTLTYREITDVIKNNKLKPYYDKENAVKYVTWNQDQWVSYVRHPQGTSL
jgi:chitinase